MRRQLTLLLFLLLLIPTVFLYRASADASASATFTPTAYTPSSAGNFTATTTAGGVTAVGVIGQETGPSGEGKGSADDGMEVDGEILYLPDGTTGRWVVSLSVDMRVEVGTLNYQRGEGWYSCLARATAAWICAQASPQFFSESAIVSLFSEEHGTVADHAILNNAGFTVYSADISFSYVLSVKGRATSTRPEVTATSWATTWNPLSGTAVAWDDTGTPTMIQSFSFQ